jgi:hypothetical protein
MSPLATGPGYLGTLGISVLGMSANPDPHAPSSPRRIWPVLAGVVVVALGLAVTAATLISGGGHPGGDPGGKVLARLRETTSAVPLQASGSTVQSSEVQWLPACPEIADAHAGWSQALVTVRFADPMDPAAVVDHIDSILRQEGWQWDDTRTSPHQGPIAHWTLRVTPSGPSANAFAFPAPSGSQNWFMTASWQPQPIDQGCP